MLNPTDILSVDVWKEVFIKLDATDLDRLVKCGNKEVYDMTKGDIRFQAAWLSSRHGKRALIHALQSASSDDALASALLCEGGRRSLLDEVDREIDEVGVTGVRKLFTDNTYESPSYPDSPYEMMDVIRGLDARELLPHDLLRKAGETLFADALWKPVHFMCSKGFTKSVASISRDPTCKDVMTARTLHGRTPLFLAIRDEKHDIVRELLRGGCFPDTVEDIRNIVTISAYTGNDDVIEYLGTRGLLSEEVLNYDGGEDDSGPPDYENEYDGEMSPVQWAAYHDRVQTCRSLLSYGADPTFVPENGDSASPLALALAHGSPALNGLLTEHMTEEDVVELICEPSEKWPLVCCDVKIARNLCAVFDAMDVAPHTVLNRDEYMVIARDVEDRVPEFMTSFFRPSTESPDDEEYESTDG